MRVSVETLLGIPYAEANCQELARRALQGNGRRWFPPDAALADRAQAPLGAATAPGWTEVDLGQVQPLDILLLGHSQDVTHMAVVVDQHEALHTTPATGSVLVPIPRLLPAAYSAWRLSR